MDMYSSAHSNLRQLAMRRRPVRKLRLRPAIDQHLRSARERASEESAMPSTRRRLVQSDPTEGVASQRPRVHC